MNDAAIKVEGVSKRFGKLVALDKVNLTAQRGKVTGLLGPNGAGKTTLIKVMATLLAPDHGSVVVNGINVLKNPTEARNHLGLAGQFAAVDDFLTGRETLEMVGQLYHLSREQAKQRAVEVLAQLDLVDAADRQAKTYSGGMRRRLDLGASLVATPPVIFLDEPTTGLDPRTRLQLWDTIRRLTHSGVTILLTTQYLEEADALADYLYVIDRGKMITEGTAAQLKSSLGQDVIEVKVASDKVEAVQGILEKDLKREVVVDEAARSLRVRTEQGSQELLAVIDLLKKKDIEPEEISLHRPSLDDVFLAITGHEAEER